MYKYPKHSLSFPAEDFLQKPNRITFTRCQKSAKAHPYKGCTGKAQGQSVKTTPSGKRIRRK
jgi:hypothetical protein